jgi:HTH-type transcriptional regulator/antitoxin HipB
VDWVPICSKSGSTVDWVPIGSKTVSKTVLVPIGTTRQDRAISLPIGTMHSSPATQVFGQRIRDQRQRLGLSQSALADVVGVNRRVIGELERGKPSVQLNIALRVAEAVGLDVALRERAR